MAWRGLASGVCIAVWGAAVAAVGQDPFKPTTPAPRWESCEELHDMYLKRFEGVEGFGVSRMHRPPMRDLSGVLDGGRVPLSLDRLELIGLQQKVPVVYTPFSHTSRPDPALKSRTLTEFEERALTAFRKGRDIAVDASQDGPAACVGAVRAKPTCLECHDGAKAGDLLGAFSYRFSRAHGGAGAQSKTEAHTQLDLARIEHVRRLAEER
jgi:hypothetical protein